MLLNICFKPPGSPQKTGVVSLTTSTTGCPPSTTDSPCPIATTLWQGTPHPPCHRAGQEESPQPHAELGILQCQINWRIWKYQHLWQRRRPAFWPLSLLWIHPRSCSPKIQDTSNQPGGHAGIPQTGKPPVLLSLSHWSRTSQEASLWKWGRHFTTNSPYSKNSKLHL